MMSSNCCNTQKDKEGASQLFGKWGKAVQIAERKGDVVEYSRREDRLLKHSKVKEEEESRLKQYSTY